VVTKLQAAAQRARRASMAGAAIVRAPGGELPSYLKPTAAAAAKESEEKFEYQVRRGAGASRARLAPGA